MALPQLHAHRHLVSPGAWRDTAWLLLRGQGVALAHHRLRAELPEWQLALCHGSETLAIWRHRDLCLLSSRDNFAQPVAIWRSPAEGSPHRRLLAWNRDDTLLAACTSSSCIHVLDARARPLYTLPPSAWLEPEAQGGGTLDPPPDGPPTIVDGGHFTYSGVASFRGRLLTFATAGTPLVDRPVLA